jgi:hypothetical protein
MKRLFLFWVAVATTFITLDVLYMDWSAPGIVIIVTLCLANFILSSMWLELLRA